jgi:uncharacterized protein YciI
LRRCRCRARHNGSAFARCGGIAAGLRRWRLPRAAQRLRNHGPGRLVATIAEAQVPRAARRLRNHGGWAAARVVAEAQVPRAAQRLRNHGGWAAARVVAEAQVPRAAQRLRNHGGWAAARVVAEAQVPPAAQRLRDDDSSAVTGCWERSQVAARRDSRPRGVADRPASSGGRANECLWLRCQSGWCGRMALRGSVRRRRPCPLRFSPSYIYPCSSRLRRRRCHRRHNASAITAAGPLRRLLRRCRCRRRHNGSAMTTVPH